MRGGLGQQLHLAVSLDGLVHRGEGDEECDAAAFDVFEPNAAAVELDQRLGDVQP